MVTRRGFLKAAAWAGEALTVATMGGALALTHETDPASNARTDTAASPQSFSYFDQNLADSLKSAIRQCTHFAQTQNLIPIMQSAAYHSGMPLAELMTLTYFESSMGQKLDVQYASDSITETARGIVQIVNEKFRELVAYYLINPAQDAIAPVEKSLDNPYDVNAQKMLAATEHAKGLVHEIRASFKTAVQTPTTASIIGDHKILDENILAGRDSPHASMVLVGKGLMRIRREHPHLSSLLTGAEFRMLHMFGPDGTHTLIQLHQSSPDMTMAQAFQDPNGAKHSQGYILENNNIPAAMTVGDFVHRFRTQHDTVCKMLADYCKDRNLNPALLQDAALIPPAIPQSSLSSLTDGVQKHTSRASDRHSERAQYQTPAHLEAHRPASVHHEKPEHHLRRH